MAFYNLLFKSGAMLGNVSDEVAIKATLIPEVVEIQFISGATIWKRPEPEVKPTGKVGGITRASAPDPMYIVVLTDTDDKTYKWQRETRESAIAKATLEVKRCTNHAETFGKNFGKSVQVFHHDEPIWEYIWEEKVEH